VAVRAWRSFVYRLGQRLAMRPTATAVCEPLSGSTPIITAVISALHIVIEGNREIRGGHALLQCWRSRPF
jgi:hypothetical protein